MKGIDVKEDKKKKLYFLYVCIALILGELLYFHTLLAGRKIMGINSDAILINLLLEHWFDVFRGKASMVTLRSFFPAVGSLGYTDALIVPGVIYSLLRAIGIDMFTAFDPALIILHFLGVIALYKTLRELGCSYILSFTGIFFSLWSCSFTQLSYHTQFFCISTVPLFFLAVVYFYKNRDKGMKKRLPWGILATFAVGTTFLSAYYIGYFTALIIGIALIIFLLFDPKERFKGFIALIKKNIGEILIYLLMQLFWVIPFLCIYLPVYSQNGGYSIAFSWTHAPDVYDILRTGGYAPLEYFLSVTLPSYLPDELYYLMPNRIMEVSCGWAVLTVVLFFAALIILIIRKKKSVADHILISISIAVLLMHFLTCRYGEFFPWVYIGKILPGADSIRAIGRYLGICTPFISLVLCVFLKDLMDKRFEDNRKKEMIVMLILCAAVIVSNQSERYTRDDIADLEESLAQVSAPPADCTGFFIIPMGMEATIYDINMYAWLIADKYGLNTINGYSGNSPLGWDLLKSDIRDYYPGLIDWIEMNGLQDNEGLYGYITGQDIWAPYSELNFTYAEP